VTGRPDCSGPSRREVRLMRGSTSKQSSWACTQFVSKSLLTLTVYLALLARVLCPASIMCSACTACYHCHICSTCDRPKSIHLMWCAVTAPVDPAANLFIFCGSSAVYGQQSRQRSLSRRPGDRFPSVSEIKQINTNWFQDTMGFSFFAKNDTNLNRSVRWGSPLRPTPQAQSFIPTLYRLGLISIDISKDRILTHSPRTGVRSK